METRERGMNAGHGFDIFFPGAKELIDTNPLNKAGRNAKAVFDGVKAGLTRVGEGIWESIGATTGTMAGQETALIDAALVRYLDKGTKVSAQLQIDVNPESALAVVDDASEPRLVVHKGEPVITLVYNYMPEP